MIPPVEGTASASEADPSAPASEAGVGPAAARLSSLRTLSTAVWVAGQVLLFSYVTAVLTSTWPIHVLDPAWRLNAATNLIDNGGIALIGLVMVHLGAQLDSRNQRRQAHRQRLARLGLAAMTGFVLLLPLQVFSGLQLFEQLKVARVSRLEKGTYRLRNLRSDLQAVNSHEELKTRLLNFQGQSLSPQELALPLPELKRQLNAQIQEAIRRIEAQFPPPGWNQARPMLLTNLRLGFTSLALAVGFAATGRRRGHSLSLLEQAGMVLDERQTIRQERQRSRAAFLRTVEEAQLEQALIAREEAMLREEADSGSATAGEIPAAGPYIRRRDMDGGIDIDYFDLLSQQQEDDEEQRRRS